MSPQLILRRFRVPHFSLSVPEEVELILLFPTVPGSPETDSRIMRYDRFRSSLSPCLVATPRVWSRLLVFHSSPRRERYSPYICFWGIPTPGPTRVSQVCPRNPFHYEAC